MVSWAILYNIQLKTDLLTGQVLHKGDFNVTHLVCDKGAVESAPRLRDNRFCNGNAFTGPFFINRRSPLDPESSKTLIVLFLTFSPELTLGSCFLVRSELVFLHFTLSSAI